MKVNMGSVDRTLRIVVGVVLIALSLFGVIGAWGWIGLVPLATGVIGYCPVYAPFGFNTCGKGRQSA